MLGFQAISELAINELPGSTTINLDWLSQYSNFSSIQLIRSFRHYTAPVFPEPPPIGKMWADAVQSNFSGFEAVQQILR